MTWIEKQKVVIAAIVVITIVAFTPLTSGQYPYPYPYPYAPYYGYGYPPAYPSYPPAYPPQYPGYGQGYTPPSYPGSYPPTGGDYPYYPPGAPRPEALVKPVFFLIYLIMTSEIYIGLRQNFEI